MNPERDRNEGVSSGGRYWKSRTRWEIKRMICGRGKEREEEGERRGRDKNKEKEERDRKRE